MNWTFRRIVGGAHVEDSGGNADHLRAPQAVAERLIRSFYARRQRESRYAYS
jgi:hypothetical protein